jgi:hypothetical protein
MLKCTQVPTLRRLTPDGPLCSDQAGMTMRKLVGDTLPHVLRYDASGACVKVPGQDTTPRQDLSVSSATAGCGYGWAIPPEPTRSGYRLPLARRPSCGVKGGNTSTSRRTA